MVKEHLPNGLAWIRSPQPLPMAAGCPLPAALPPLRREGGWVRGEASASLCSVGESSSLLLEGEDRAPLWDRK